MNRKLIKQIKFIIRELVSNSLVNINHEPIYKADTKEILWSSSEEIFDISYVLNNDKYENIYKECLNKKAFTFQMIDGSLVQLMYKLDRRGKKIISHRLAYLPNPNIDLYANKENFEEEYYDSEDFLTEYVDINSHPTPIRFDYDNDDTKYVEHYHTYSHLTFGNYKDCRIPINTPISPYKFIDFILRSFYFKKYINFHEKCELSLDNILSENEKRSIYLKV